MATTKNATHAVMFRCTTPGNALCWSADWQVLTLHSREDLAHKRAGSERCRTRKHPGCEFKVVPVSEAQ